MTKQEFLAVYEAATGVELCETTKMMWLGQPWPAFLAKLEESYAWAGCGGKVDIMENENLKGGDNILDRAFVALLQTVPVWVIMTATVLSLVLHFQNLGLKAEIAELRNRRPYIIHVVDSPGGMMLGQVTDKVVIDGIYTVTIGHKSRYKVTKEQFDSIIVGDPAPGFLQQKGTKQ